MRSCAVIVALACAGFARPVPADDPPAATQDDDRDDFPYTAIVNADGVHYRSGPGTDFYPTGELLRGDPVEVYRRAAGGWCAIRPPEGSFSWIAARHVEMIEPGLGVVKAENVPSRVGSLFDDPRDVQQVQLEKGEEIEIIGAETSPGEDRPTWYKIAPPAGEFRWVQGKYLTRGRGEGPLWKPSDRPLPTAHRGDVEPPDEIEPGTNESRTSASESDWSRQGPGRDSRGRRKSSAAVADFQEELDAIDLELAQMVLQEPSEWTFDELDDRGQALLTRAAAPRSGARFGRCWNGLRGSGISESGGSPWMRGGPRPRPAADRTSDARQRGGPAPATVAQDRFDGTGRLTRVISKGPGGPQYALVDESGEVRQYVTAAPGVNLQRYVGHEVGVTGLRGYMPELNADHLTARRVKLMDGPTVR